MKRTKGRNFYRSGRGKGDRKREGGWKKDDAQQRGSAVHYDHHDHRRGRRDGSREGGRGRKRRGYFFRRLVVVFPLAPQCLF